jgi:hypothetical protein
MEPLCPLVQSSGEAVRDQLTLGGILRAFLPVLLHLLNLGAHKLRVLWQLAACGTPALGANLFYCPPCQHRHWAPRSCGNRHCPRCLGAKSWQWLEKQTRSLLPITYYHCVFTLPAEVNSLMLANQRKLYPLLFDCAAQSLLDFGCNRLKGDLGITAVLHTWGQKLDFHPHLHCIVTGGALSPDGKQWRPPKQRKDLTLSALEFIRRFSLLILPPRLVRIRHPGILGNNRRRRDIEAVRAIFKRRGCAVELQPQSIVDPPCGRTCCPLCGKAGIRLLAFTDAAGVLHMIGAGPMPFDSS